MNKNSLSTIFKNSKIETKAEGKNKHGFLKKVISFIATIIITIPLFIILYQYVPETKIVIADTYNLRFDHILSFIIVFALINLLVKLLKNIVFGIAIMVIIVLTINFFRNKYSYKDIYTDYKSLVMYLVEKPVKVPFLPESAHFRNATKVNKAIVYDDPGVRNYAIVNSLKYFSDNYYYRKYGNVVRYFSIFKEINTKWKYVPDPVDEEYYASSKETILHLSGDCDDHSIMMASCIKAIGGEVRLVRTIGHLYPEVKVCHRRDLDRINLLIRELFEEETKGKSIYFHIDKDGFIWLNFDYSDSYPGGKFMNVKIVDILNV